MKTIDLGSSARFNESNPHSEPLHVDANGRALLFALRPGQTVREHNAPHSPVNIVVLKGHGFFAGGDKKESLLGPNTLLVIAPGEQHAIRATDEDLVFLAILHGAPDAGKLA
jgi:quercetin dioxygenase-like cupin family protein